MPLDDLPDLSAYAVKKPKIEGDPTVAQVVDDELARLGWSDNARLSALGDIGRENSWNRNIIFKGHSDPANNEYNRGIISWQKDRVQKLDKYLKANKLYGRNDDEELRGMVRFMDEEMRSNDEWKDIHQKMRDPNISTFDASENLRKYIKYVPGGKYNSYDPKFRVKNNARWAEQAQSLGLGKLPDLSEFGGNELPDLTEFAELPDLTQFATSEKPVTEKPETIDAQIQASLDPNVKTRFGVLTTDPSQNAMFGNRTEFTAIPTKEGTLWLNTKKIFSNKKLKLRNLADLRQYVEKNPNALTTLLGIAENVGNNTQGTAVVAKDADGNELAAGVVTNHASAVEQAKNYKDQFPNAQIEVTNTDNVVKARKDEVQGVISDAPNFDAQIKELEGIGEAAKQGVKYAPTTAIPPTVHYTKRDTSKPGDYWNFETTGKAGNLDYLGMVGGKHVAKNLDGDTFEFDETAKTFKPTTPLMSKLKFQGGKQFTKKKDDIYVDENNDEYKVTATPDEKGGFTYISKPVNPFTKVVQLEDGTTLTRDAKIKDGFRYRDDEGELYSYTTKGIKQVNPPNWVNGKLDPNTVQLPEDRKALYEDFRKNHNLRDSGELRKDWLRRDRLVATGKQEEPYSQQELDRLDKIKNGAKIAQTQKAKQKFLANKNTPGQQGQPPKENVDVAIKDIDEQPSEPQKFETSRVQTKDEPNVLFKVVTVDTKPYKGDRRAIARTALKQIAPEIGLSDAQIEQELDRVKNVGYYTADEKNGEVNIAFTQGDVERIAGKKFADTDLATKKAQQRIEAPGVTMPEIQQPSGTILQQIRGMTRSEIEGENLMWKYRFDPLYREALNNVADVGGTAKDVDDEYARLMSNENLTRQEAIEFGREKGRQYSDDTLGSLESGFVGEGGKAVSYPAAIMRAANGLIPGLNDVGGRKLQNWLTNTSLAMQAAGQVEAEKNPGVVSSVLRLTGSAPGFMSRFAVSALLPGGARLTFAKDAAITSFGEGNDLGQVFKDAGKGAVMDILFGAGSKFGDAVRKGTLNKLLPKSVIDAIESGALETAYKGTDEAKKAFINAARRSLVADVLGTSARIGVIGGGTYTLAAAEGSQHPGMDTAMMLAFDLVTHAKKIGKMAKLSTQVWRIPGKTSEAKPREIMFLTEGGDKIAVYDVTDKFPNEVVEGVLSKDVDRSAFIAREMPGQTAILLPEQMPEKAVEPKQPSGGKSDFIPTFTDQEKSEVLESVQPTSKSREVQESKQTVEPKVESKAVEETPIKAEAPVEIKEAPRFKDGKREKVEKIDKQKYDTLDFEDEIPSQPAPVAAKMDVPDAKVSVDEKVSPAIPNGLKVGDKVTNGMYEGTVIDADGEIAVEFYKREGGERQRQYKLDNWVKPTEVPVEGKTEVKTLDDIAKEVAQYPTVDKAFEAFKKRNDISADIAQAFADKYKIENDTPRQAFEKFYNDVTAKPVNQSKALRELGYTLPMQKKLSEAEKQEIVDKGIRRQDAEKKVEAVEPSKSEGAEAKDATSKTNLDLILDRVTTENEVTLSIKDDISREQIEKVEDAAKARGMTAFFTGRGFLIQKNIEESPTQPPIAEGVKSAYKVGDTVTTPNGKVKGTVESVKGDTLGVAWENAPVEGDITETTADKVKPVEVPSTIEKPEMLTQTIGGMTRRGYLIDDPKLGKRVQIVKDNGELGGTTKYVDSWKPVDQPMRQAITEDIYEQAKDDAGRIRGGSLEVRRLDSRGEQGRIKGGQRAVEASVLIGRDEAQRQEASQRGGSNVESRSDIQSRQEKLLETYAKREGIWYDWNKFFGDRHFTYGGEAFVYRQDGNTVVKTIDYRHIDKGLTPLGFLDNRIALYNHIFPETPYELMGVTKDNNGKLRFVVKQPYIETRGVSKADVDAYMRSKGFEPTGRESYSNGIYQVFDVHEKNATQDAKGNIYIIDAVPKLVDESMYRPLTVEPVDQPMAQAVDNDWQARVERELADVKEVRNDKGQLLAPNGKPSNLNELQWKQVRTPSFIEYFGDWINDPENASKVVDENGEPLVVYHGSSSSFDVFQQRKGTLRVLFSEFEVDRYGFFFTPDPNLALSFGVKTIPVFLNIRQLVDFTTPNETEAERRLIKELGFSDKFFISGFQETWELFDGERGQTFTDGLKQLGYDGVIFSEPSVENERDGGITYVALRPTQIKSAIGNRGTFDANEDSILKRTPNAADKASFENAKSIPARQLIQDVDFNKNARVVEDGVVAVDEIREVELIRRLINEANGTRGGAFYGVFNSKKLTKKFLDTLTKKIKSANEKGIDTKQLKTLKMLVTNASKQDGTVIFAMDEEALTHEKVHRALNRYQTGTSKIAPDVQDAITNSPIFKKVSEGEWGRAYATANPANKVEEFITAASTLDWDALGIKSEADKRAAMSNVIDYYNSYAETNKGEGTAEEVLNALATEIAYVKEITNQDQKVQADEGTASEADGDSSIKDAERKEDRPDVKTEGKPDELAGKLKSREPGKSGLAFDEAEAEKAREAEMKVAAMSRAFGSEMYYVPVGMEETAATARQMIDDRGMQSIIQEALTGQPSAAGKLAVYWEMQRLSTQADMFKEDGREAEANVILNQLSDLAAALAVREQEMGREINISKWLPALSPEAAIMTAEKMVRKGFGDTSTISTDQTAKVKELAAELQKVRTQQARSESIIAEQQRIIDNLDDEKPARVLNRQEALLENYKKKEKIIRAELAKRFPDSPVFNGEQSMLMAVGENTPKEVIIDPETASLLKDYTIGQVLTNRTYNEVIAEIQAISGASTEQAKDIHSLAMDEIRGAKEPTSEEAKKRIQIRQEHYQEADKHSHPEKQAKKAIQLAEANLKRQIDTLEKEIASGQKEVKTKNKVTSPEIERLKRERDALKSTRDELLGEGSTDEQKIARAIKSTRRSIDRLTEKIQNNDTSVKTAEKLSNKELDNLKAERKTLQSILNDIRKEARKVAQTPKSQLTKIARQVAEKFPDDLELILAAQRLTGKDPKSINEVINYLQNTYGFHITEAKELAQQAWREVQKIKESNKQAKDAARGIIEEERKKLDQIRVDKNNATRALNRFLSQLAANPNVIKRFNDDFRAKLVSNWGTQIFNAVQSTTVTTPAQILLDMFEAQLRSLGLNIGESSDVRARDAWRAYQYIFANNRKLAEQALAHFPEQYFEVHSGLLGDIPIDPLKLADTKKGLAKLAHRWFDANAKLNEKLTHITGAKLQEMHFRNAIVASTFDAIIRKRTDGKSNLEKAMADGTFKDIITEKDAQRAAARALEVTFASQINDPIGRELKKMYDKLDNYLPVLLNPVTYARFTYTTTKVMVLNPLTFGLTDQLLDLKNKPEDRTPYNTRDIAKGVLAWGTVVIAYGLMSALGGDDDKWYTLYPLGKDGPVWDIRRTFPLSAFFYTAHVIKESGVEGKPLPSKSEMLAGFASLETDYFQYGPVLELLGEVKDYAVTKGEKGEVKDAAIRTLGNYLAGMTRFFKPFRDTLAQFDAEERAYRDDPKTAQDKFINELSRSIPGIIRLSDQEKQYDIEGNPLEQKFPLGRIFGVNIANPALAKNKDSAATAWANELFPFVATKKMTPEERKMANARSAIREAVRAGKKVNVDDALENMKVTLSKKSLLRLKDELKYSELGAKVKYAFGDNPEKVKALKTIWKYATDQEKQEIQKVLREKKDVSRETKNLFQK